MNPILRVNDRFEDRHIGPRSHEISHMLTTVGASSIDELIHQTVPANIALKSPLTLPEPLTETEVLARLKTIAQKNIRKRSFIGMG